MGTALIGSAVIGGVGSAIAGSKNSKAINKATAAQTQSNTEAVAAQREARQQNLALQQPIYNAGMPAINARNALLGLGGVQAPQQAAQHSFPTQQPMQQSPFNALGGEPGFNRMGWNTVPRGVPMQQQPTQQQQQAQAAQPGQSPQAAASDAFDMFRNSTGYQFRVNEGMDALNSGFAGAGVLQSGAALKGLDDYRQGMASAEFGNYMGYLGDQQMLTAGAANAMSGVNTNYANNTGNLAIAQGNNLANSAVARANNSNAMIGGIGNALGGVMGGLAYGGGMGGMGGGAAGFGMNLRGTGL
jgi:hypothetical protein